MSRFLLKIISLLFIVVILLGTAFLVRHYLLGKKPLNVSEGLSDAVTSATSSPTKAGEAVAEKFSIPEEGIALSSLSLSESQKKALSAAGIDVSTFVLTPAMVACGEEKLGSERLAGITKGESPSFKEITSLIPCLTAR